MKDANNVGFRITSGSNNTKVALKYNEIYRSKQTNQNETVQSMQTGR